MISITGTYGDRGRVGKNCLYKPFYNIIIIMIIQVRICVREVSLTLVSFTHLIGMNICGSAYDRGVHGRWHVGYGSVLSIIMIIHM